MFPAPPARAAFDGAFDYPGLFGQPGRCRLRLYRSGGLAVAVCTELGPENPTTSVTNASEMLASAVCERFGIPPADLRLVEHWPEGVLRSVAGELFQSVTYGQTARAIAAPTWHRIGSAEVERLIGGAFPPPGR